MRSCDCASRSVVYTCPVCSGKAYGALSHLCAEVRSQMDLFEKERESSVSAYIDLLDYEFEQKRIADRPSDGLPF